jgi:uncharacterized protein YjbJ (UPF0337 family)
MDRDRIEGSAKTVMGRIKAWIGSRLGDGKLEADGRTDQVAGRVQNTVGGVKDALRDDNRR